MNKDKKKRHIPLAYKAEEAFKRAVAEALAEHRLHGIPIAIWRDAKWFAYLPTKLLFETPRLNTESSTR
jgi:hypothetical protein